MGSGSRTGSFDELADIEYAPCPRGCGTEVRVEFETDGNGHVLRRADACTNCRPTSAYRARLLASVVHELRGSVRDPTQAGPATREVSALRGVRGRGVKAGVMPGIRRMLFVGGACNGQRLDVPLPLPYEWHVYVPHRAGVQAIAEVVPHCSVDTDAYRLTTQLDASGIPQKVYRVVRMNRTTFA